MAQWLTDPSITNQVQPAPNPLDAYARFAQLKNLGLQQQLGQQRLQQEQQMAPIQQQTAQLGLQNAQLENQQREQSVSEAKTLQQLQPQFVKRDDQGRVSGYDFDGFANKAIEMGVRPQVVSTLQTQRAETTLKLAQASEATKKLEDDKNKEVYGMLEDVKSTTDPALRQEKYQRSLMRSQQLGVNVLNLPPQVPNNDVLSGAEASIGMHAQLLADANSAAERLKNSAQADEASAKADEARKQTTTMGSVTPAMRYQQQQENYRATLSRQAATSNELQKQGIASLQKQSDTYSQFLGTANSLKQSLYAAQNGNEMAAAVAPLQGTLFVTTAEGVKRINETELRGVSGAGSLVQRINGLLGKQTGKGPLSDDLKKDMASLVDLYQQSKYQTYKNQADYTQKLHGLDPKSTPVLDANGNIAGAPTSGAALSQPTGGADEFGQFGGKARN